MIEYTALSILWGAWCAIHSLLIHHPKIDKYQGSFPEGKKYFRIVYNLIAVLTLIPVLFYMHRISGPYLFTWPGGWRAVQVLLAASAIVLFVSGARRYDLFQFLGIRQVRGENDCGLLTADCSLDNGGVLGMVRHPLYSGGILILWARPLDVAAIVTNVVLTAYFIAGAFLEEQKLSNQFGRQYADYRRQVSMFFPIKWLMKQVRTR